MPRDLCVEPVTSDLCCYPGASAPRCPGFLAAPASNLPEHLSYLPFSGSVLSELAGELEGYTMTKSALHFSVDRPLPKTLVRKLIAARRSKAARS